MNRRDPRHGLRAGYLAGCRTECCRTPHLEYLKERRALRRDAYNRAQKDGRIRRERLQAAGVTTFQFPAQPVRDHIKRLAALGWSTTAMAAMHGDISDASIADLLHRRSLMVVRKTHLLINLKYTLRVDPEVPDTALVPALGAVRRDRALMALGWTHHDIHEAMRDLLGYDVSRCSEARQIAARRWRAYDTVYRALQGTPGPSQRTRDRAAALGYATPLAWESIDDPDARPTGRTAARRPRKTEIDDIAVHRVIGGDRNLDLTKAERAEVAGRLRAAGWSDRRIQEHTGIKADRYLPAQRELGRTAA